MKKTILIFSLTISLCFLCKISMAQSPDWLWAKRAGGIENDAGRSLSVDALGNIYLAGNFSSPTITFNSVTLTNSGSNSSDLFLVKYNANDSVLWAISAGGTGWDLVSSIAVDALGNIYMAGYFIGSTISFGTNTLNNANPDTRDLFLAKFDANGNVLWAKSAGGTNYEYAHSVAVDDSGYVYLVGNYGSYTLTLDSTTLTSVGGTDIFIAKYDTNGTMLWAKSAGGTDDDDALSVTVDNSGNIYVAGYSTSPSITFGDTTISHGSSWGLYLAAYDNNGNVLWVRDAIGVYNVYANSVNVDNSGNIYLGGYFGSALLDFGSISLTNVDNTSNTSDIFLTKYDADGNLIWAKSAGGPVNEVMNEIDIDSAGNSYVTGYFSSPMLSFGSITLATAGWYDAFIAKYDTYGNVLWAKSIGSTDDERANSVASSVAGNVYLTGYFASFSVSFGSNTLINANNTENSDDVFLAELDNTSGINTINNSLDISVYPNPVLDQITLIVHEKATIEILNINGQIIKTKNTDDNVTKVDLEYLQSGVYIIKVIMEKGIITKKFIKQ